jgi:hypothetical protein
MRGQRAAGMGALPKRLRSVPCCAERQPHPPAGRANTALFFWLPYDVHSSRRRASQTTPRAKAAVGGPRSRTHDRPWPQSTPGRPLDPGAAPCPELTSTLLPASDSMRLARGTAGSCRPAVAGRCTAEGAGNRDERPPQRGFWAPLVPPNLPLGRSGCRSHPHVSEMEIPDLRGKSSSRLQQAGVGVRPPPSPFPAHGPLPSGPRGHRRPRLSLAGAAVTRSPVSTLMKFSTVTS